MRSRLLRVALVLALGSWPSRALGGQQVDFTRDVRPILSRHCFKCHGPDDKARKAKLRLDLRAGALGVTKSGARPIVGPTRTARLPRASARVAPRKTASGRVT